MLELTREIGPTLVRYPGGNFVSNYRWEDGVGPRDQRPTRLDLAWHSIETNQFGLHDFMAWADKVETEPMMAVNLGTRGLQEACDLLEYTNHAGGTYWSDRRIANGATDPFGVKLWCLGNEMDGPWQVGHKTAAEYGRLANETGKAMRLIDGDIELVACGSSNSSMPTFGAWESTVLEHCYDTVDYISLHAYYEERDDDALSFLASAVNMDRFIESVVATADAVRARGRHSKRINLSFDEWNVWYQRRFSGDGPKPSHVEWKPQPRLIEDEYTVTDAVVVGTFLNSLLRHGDRVTVACQAQLVNVIGLLRSEPGGEAWKQTIAYPFEQMARLARGQILQVVATSDLFDSDGLHRRTAGRRQRDLRRRDRPGGRLRGQPQPDRGGDAGGRPARHRRQRRARGDHPARPRRTGPARQQHRASTTRWCRPGSTTTPYGTVG